MPTLPKSSQSLKQCQHCFKSDSRDVPLKCCKDCKRAHYCSEECQRAEWKRHKPECKATKQNLEMMKQTLSGAGISVGEAEKVSKSWVQIFRPLLTVSALHALAIQQDSGHVLTHVLHIGLSPNFTADNIPRKANALRYAFKFDSASVLAIEEAFVSRPQDRPAIEALLRRSREVRAQSPKAIGYAIVMVFIPECNLARVVPLGIEEDPGVPWDSQWKDRLAENIHRGISG